MIKVKIRHEYEVHYNPMNLTTGEEKHYTGTTCTILENDEPLAVGIAKLGLKDQFSRPYGRSLAFYRALDDVDTLKITNEEKRAIRKAAGDWLKSHNISLLPRTTIQPHIYFVAVA